VAADARLTTLAQDDAVEIFRRIRREDPAAARRFLDRLEGMLLLLAARPTLLAERRTVGRGIRAFTIGPYQVWFEPTPSGLRVLRILHGARAPDRIGRSVRSARRLPKAGDRGLGDLP
jgi:toxin ParE1/3/4